MSWDQLLDIFKENAEFRAEEQSTPPVDCPDCGTTLDVGQSGTLHCPFDGWTWEGNR
jgi:hypothetical protein